MGCELSVRTYPDLPVYQARPWPKNKKETLHAYIELDRQRSRH